MINESGIIFVFAYQQSFNVLYNDKLLEIVMKDFMTNQLPLLKKANNIFYTLPEKAENNKIFLSFLNKWENFCKNKVAKKGNQNRVHTKILLEVTQAQKKNQVRYLV